MSGETECFNLNFDQCELILLDVAGTTTSMNFVKNTLFEYTLKNAEDYLKANLETDEVKSAIKLLQESSEEKKLEVGQVLEIIKKFSDENSNNTGFKSLQSLICLEGYTSGKFKGHVYADVAEALQKWSKKGKIAIYSTGTTQMQIELFKHSTEGNLSEFINRYFDQSEGSKTDSSSYVKIAASVDVKPNQVLFITDNVDEAKAAKEAGANTVLVEREGNAEISKDIRKEFPVIKSFSEVSVDVSGKRKSDEDVSEAAEAPPTKLPKTEEASSEDKVCKKTVETSEVCKKTVETSESCKETVETSEPEPMEVDSSSEPSKQYKTEKNEIEKETNNEGVSSSGQETTVTSNDLKENKVDEPEKMEAESTGEATPETLTEAKETKATDTKSTDPEELVHENKGSAIVGKKDEITTSEKNDKSEQIITNLSDPKNVEIVEKPVEKDKEMEGTKKSIAKAEEDKATESQKSTEEEAKICDKIDEVDKISQVAEKKEEAKLEVEKELDKVETTVTEKIVTKGTDVKMAKETEVIADTVESTTANNVEEKKEAEVMEQVDSTTNDKPVATDSSKESKIIEPTENTGTTADTKVEKENENVVKETAKVDENKVTDSTVNNDKKVSGPVSTAEAECIVDPKTKSELELEEKENSSELANGGADAVPTKNGVESGDTEVAKNGDVKHGDNGVDEESEKSQIKVKKIDENSEASAVSVEV